MEFIKGTILKRPSKHCKSPYVADVLLEDGSEIIAHAPSLGCCGLCEKDSIVYMILHEKPKLCTHVIHISEFNNTLIGIHPKSGEKIIKNLLQTNCFPSLEDIISFKQETKILNSRFDFTGLDKDNNPFIVEVKSSPLAKNNKSYFPDGYRKKKGDVVSPRALKHVQELKEIKIAHPEYRTILCFIIQRDDTSIFTINDEDKIYKDAVIDAKNSGVEIIALQVKWKLDGTYIYTKKLTIIY